MDSWDPTITDGLAQGREVILFNNAGVGSSNGEVPNTFAEMAKNAEAFIDALGLTKVDVLGFSIGSMISQLIALDRPDLVRRPRDRWQRTSQRRPYGQVYAGSEHRLRNQVREPRRLLDRWLLYAFA